MNSTSLSVLTSSFALLAFSKYRRTQIAPITDHTALFASLINFIALYSAGFQQVLTGSNYPPFLTYIAGKPTLF